MKNWRTTLAGLVTGLPFLIDALVQAYNAGAFTDKSGWQLFGAIGWIVVTFLVKDFNVTGSNKPDIQKLLDEQSEDIGIPKPRP